MSEWKTGEPLEDGWYWVARRLPSGACHIEVLVKDGEDWWFHGTEMWRSWADDWRWQGPLTAPEVPHG